MENVASRFGQRLAHTEKKYRDQALKKLSLYLTKRTEWSDLEWDKLWKALFYCMWMSDKRPVQEELSSNLASLVHKVPTVEDALSFVESFFRTMHREWHGIDGLRLDKFYSLIRKFVHQTLLLLKNHEWETALVERFVSILSSEIMSQLPNGLRLHVTDLFLTELHGAASDSVDTETFLLLLEPFYTLMSSEYDKTVFKRVRELVFLPLLNEYKFGAQTPKKADDETDGEEDEEESKVFEHVELPAVQHRIFAIASADDTAERNRSILYELYSQFFRVTKVDSLKANQEAEKNPKKKVEKKRKQPEPEAEAEAEVEEPKKKKNKKRRKNKNAEEDEDVAMEDTKQEEPVAETATPEKKKKSKKESAESKTPENTPVKASSEETPTKKQKKAAKEVVAEAAKTLETTPETTKKSKKAAKEDVDAVVTKEDTPSKKSKKEAKAKEEPVAVEEVTPSKKQKKEKKEKAAEPVVEEAAPAKKEKKEPKKVEDNVVVRSGMKFRRCACCGGLGKGVVPVGKDLCGHCQRTGGVAKTKAAPAKAKAEKVKAEKTPVVAEKTKPAKVKAETPAKSEEKPAKDANVVVRSGMKMRRCAGCGGIGKGLVPVGKDMCGHCQRTGQQKKKEQVATKKKRKAEELAAAAVEEDTSAPSKKVTFGKNRALPHELSVKRLKASAKETAVKELSSDIKGVLKAGTTPPKTSTKAKKEKKDKTGGRMKAADFF